MGNINLNDFAQHQKLAYFSDLSNLRNTQMNFIKPFIIIALCTFVVACDSEQIKKLKKTVQDKASAATGNKSSDSYDNLFDRTEAESYLKKQLPKQIIPGEFSFTAAEKENKKYGDYVAIEFLVETTYKSDLYF